MQRVYNNGGKYESYRDNAPVHNKACSFCGERKVLDDFPTQKAGRAGRNARCRVCCNLHVRSQAYEISVDAIHTMLEKQDGRCAACSVDLKMSGRGRDSFVVDHCHSTGDVRGLLCGICNRALGMLGDNAETVGALYRYIRDSQ